MSLSAVDWVSATTRDAHLLSDRAVVAGYQEDNSPLWVIRAKFKNDLVPGKLAISQKLANIPWGGQEHTMDNFEVCCAPPGSVQWVESSNGDCPPNAVPAGHTVSGETLYAARVKHQGSLAPGKVHPSHKTMYISFKGKEIKCKTYEVLCTVPVEWIRTTAKDAHTLSDRAVVAGYQDNDKSPLWLIRAKFENDLVPGKLAINYDAAYVAWEGKENAVHDFEVCCARPEMIRWVESRNGSVPTNAVVAGKTASGELVYAGRAREQGYLIPGKVSKSRGAIYISYDEKEYSHQDYEVLCTA